MRNRDVSGWLLGVTLFALGAGCSTAADEEALGTYDDRLTKCQEITPGDSNFCNDPACPCTLGEGDCDSAAQCVSGLGCTGKGTYWGYASNFNVCAGLHCNNKKLDGDETQTDCGGSCGTTCPPPQCGSLPANGVKGHCTADCKCPPLDGGCTASNQCTTGVCTLNQGTAFGYAPTIGVCTAATCSNTMQDGNETGVDCGGFCVPCGGEPVASAAYGNTSSERVMDFTYDASGNLIIVGRFGLTINFGPTSATALTGHGGSDIFVAKFDQSGKFLWSKGYGGPHNDGDGALAVATDAGSGIYVGGNTYAGANFGFGAVTTADASSDAFLVKLSGADGTAAWQKIAGGAGADRVTAITVGPTGAVFVAGSYSNTINLGGATFTAASTGIANRYDMFVTKLSAAGGHSWSRSFGGLGSDPASDVAVDPSGYPYLVGNFGDTVTFGTFPLVANGGGDGVVLKLSPGSGAPIWARAIGGTTNNDGVSSVAIGANGVPVIAGYFVGVTDLGLGNVTPNGTDMFVEALNSSTGAATWVQTGGGASTDRALALAVETSTNEVIVTGSLTTPTAGDSATFGSTMVTPSPGGGIDFFVARYAGANGALRWAIGYGGAGTDDTAAIGTFGGVVGVAGRFQGSGWFGGSTFSATNFDGFLARYKL